MRTAFCICGILLTTISSAQPTQAIRGRVLDADTRITIPGAMIRVMQSDSVITGAITDPEGLFRIEMVPVGRYTIDVSYTGYKPTAIADVIVTSAKEIVLEIELAEAAEKIKEVVITKGQKGEARNEMALVSSRSFTINETDRYAGSRGDPARMASNFAGVQGNDDSNNGIIVRGNSPYFLAWRLENIYIPNPNHFAVVGRSSGPVSMLNNKYLANSDFFTGAFPATYGNSIGSVFDLRMRNGNNEKHEASLQFGLLGAEVFAEGPLKKHPPTPLDRGERVRPQPSYIINYRYATLFLFKGIGFDIGTLSIPKYQDLSFKLNFPGRNNSTFSVFALAGQSSAKLTQSEIKDTTITDIYQSVPTDEDFRCGRATLGANWGKSVSSKTFVNVHAAGILDYSANEVYNIHRHTEADSFVVDSLTFDREFLDKFHRIEVGGFVSTKPAHGQVIKFGLDVSTLLFDFYERNAVVQLQNLPDSLTYERYNFRGLSMFVQPFVDYKRYLGEKVELLTGLHGAYLTHNGSKSIEPRIGLRWNVAQGQNITLGAGLHSQMQLPYYYLPRTLVNDSYELTNFDLDFFRSAHGVAGYSRFIGSNVRVKTEVYYQYLYSIPVESSPSSFSQLNEGEDYTDLVPDSLVSEGTGRNMGVELTIERFYSKGYFFLLTGSLFDAKYKGSNGIAYNTAFNGRYAANVLAGKEFKWGKTRKTTFGISAKVTLAGGRRSTPIDTVASIAAGEAVYIDSLRNSIQLKDYFRTDLRISYNLSSKKVAHEVGIDLLNVFNTYNALRRVYKDGQIVEVPQIGFLPVFYYRIDI